MTEVSAGKSDEKEPDSKDREPDEAPETPTDEPRPPRIEDPPASDNGPLTVTPGAPDRLWGGPNSEYRTQRATGIRVNVA